MPQARPDSLSGRSWSSNIRALLGKTHVMGIVEVLSEPRERWRRLLYGIQRDNSLQKMNHQQHFDTPESSEPATGPIDFVSVSDLELIVVWLRQCDQNHGEHCQSPEKAARRHLSWLIDVRKKCLVQGTDNEVYVALSYMWGAAGADSLQLTSKNREELQNPGAFDNMLCPLRLPKTISQAINITRLIGQRYLWVDRLCIDQDDEVAKVAQINGMASVYSGAYLTLVAACGDSVKDGFDRNRDIAERKTRRLVRSSNFGNTDSQFVHQRGLSRSLWSTRGWTFQEMIFSQRAVFFFSDLMTWECHCETWDDDCYVTEAITANRCDKRFMAGVQSLQASTEPDLEEYSRLVKEYNTRNLTYATDTVAAFSGITTVQSRAFRQGFLQGLPVQYFDAALLWQPFGRLERRLPEVIVNDVLYIPTWSWMAWKGKLDLRLWAGGCEGNYEGRPMHPDYDWRMTLIKITPLVQWHVINHRRQWGRIIATSDQQSQELLPKQLARANSVEKQDTRSGDMFQEAPLIGCQTERSWFYLGAEIKNPHDFHTVRLVDSRNVCHGVIRLDGTTDNHHEAKTTVKTLTTQPLCELIAISEGAAQDSLDETWALEEWKQYRKTDASGCYRWYNVLWIEWKGDIACRKALGRVYRLSWDNATKEPIDIILG